MRRKSPGDPENPFAVLGLPSRSDLTDEDVRAAWRRIAAVTHPDLEDGGDPAEFSAAAAAYDTLRTAYGRGEALADFGFGGHPAGSRRFHARGAHRAAATRSAARAGLARYLGFLGLAGAGRGTGLRAASVVVAAAAVAVVGWTPASIALLVGAATWLLAPVTGRGRWRRGGRDR